MYSYPSKVYQKFLNKSIDKRSAIKTLVSIIRKSEDEILRLKSLNYLIKIGSQTEDTFYLLEEILISDPNRDVRSKAIEGLELFSKRSMKPIKWALTQESDYHCFIKLIIILSTMKEPDVKVFFINYIKTLLKKRYIGKNKIYSNLGFRKSVKKLIIIQDFEKISLKDLAEIVMNWRSMASLINRFQNIFCDWEKGYVVRLDLSRIGWNLWTSLMFRYSNWIRTLSEVPEIKNLKRLKSLDLSNNLLKEIKGLEKLNGLTHLSLRNNILSDRTVIRDLKSMPNLKWVDLRGNPIAETINQEDFQGLIVMYEDPYFIF